MELTVQEIRIVELVCKRVKNILGETITKHICMDVFRDRQAEKRVFLTEIEVDFKKDIDLYLEKIKEGKNETRRG